MIKKSRYSRSLGSKGDSGGELGGSYEFQGVGHSHATGSATSAAMGMLPKKQHESAGGHLPGGRGVPDS